MLLVFALTYLASAASTTSTDDVRGVLDADIVQTLAAAPSELAAPIVAVLLICGGITVLTYAVIRLLTSRFPHVMYSEITLYYVLRGHDLPEAVQLCANRVMLTRKERR
ncbi:MAG: hypothetical protein OXQ29_04755 [Rhodospirillaceae bacterium]|nr:hypothetical protein [Rhodospirillaceae bacterium]